MAALMRSSTLVAGRTSRAGVRNFGVAFVFPLVPAVLAMGLYAQVLHGLADVPGFPASSYVDWLVPGLVLFPAMTGAGVTAMGMATDLRNGYFDRLRLVPVHPLADVGGRLAFDALRVVPAIAGVLVLGAVLGSDLLVEPARLAGLVVYGAAWSVVYNAAFLLVGVKTRSDQAVQSLAPVFAPVTFLATVWFPAELMPGWAARVAEASPMSAVTEGARAIATGQGAGGDIALGVVTMLVLGLVLVGAATRALTSVSKGADR
jgi:ABC-2 type transport system permease protein